MMSIGTLNTKWISQYHSFNIVHFCTYTIVVHLKGIVTLKFSKIALNSKNSSQPDVKIDTRCQNLIVGFGNNAKQTNKHYMNYKF